MSWLDGLGEQFGVSGRKSYMPEDRVSADKAINANNYYFGGYKGAADTQAQNMNQTAVGYQSRTGPQLNTADLQKNYFGAQMQQDAAAGRQQQGFADYMQKAAMGNAGPSAAELAMQRQSSNAAQQQMMMAAAAGGGPGAVASQMRAQNQNAVAQGQLQQDLGVQRAQEQLAARELYANQLGQMRGQAIQSGQAFGGMGIGMAQANQSAALQQGGMNDAMTQFYAQQALQTQMAGQQGGQAYNDAYSQYLLGLEQANASRYGTREQSDQARFGGSVGLVGAVAGSALAMSDVRAKENIAPAGQQISQTFREFQPYSFNYKDPATYGAGRVYGGMAQDLEKTPAGASVVQPGPGGMKTVDTGRLSTLTAAEVAQQRKELDELKLRKELDAAEKKSTAGLDKKSATQGLAELFARGMGQAGANMTGGQNTAGAILDAKNASDAAKKAEADRLAQQNERDARLLALMQQSQASQAQAIQQPRVTYPTPYMGY